MQVSISNFRCYREPVTFTFPINKTTLLKGASGAGKTTIFQAVYWALYGKLKKVGPWDRKQAKTNVTLSFYYLGRPIQIIRTRNPCRLVLQGWSNTVIEDKEAQAAISQMMGQELVWLSSSYLGQKLLNAFITAPNDGKTELLHSLTFSEESPELFISNVEQQYKDLKKEYDITVNILNSKVTRFNQLYSDVDWSVTTPVEELQNTDRQLRIELSQLYTALGEYKSKTSQRNMLLSQISKLGTPRSTDEIKGEIESLSILLKKLIERDRLILEEEKLRSTFKEVDSYTLDDLAAARQAEDIYNSRMAEFKEISVPYSEIAKLESLAHYTKVLSEQQSARDSQNLRISLQQQISTVQGKISSVNNIISEISKHIAKVSAVPSPSYVPKQLPDTAPIVVPIEEKVNELRKDLTQLTQKLISLRQGLDVLTCPHCSGHVRYNSGALTSAEHKTDPQELTLVQNQIEETNSLIQKLLLTQQQEQAALSKYNTEVAVERQRKEQYTKDLEQAEERIKLVESMDNQLKPLEMEVSDHKMKLKHLEEELSKVVLFDIPLLTKEQEAGLVKIVDKLKNLEVVPPPTRSSREISLSLQQTEINAKYRVAKEAAEVAKMTAVGSVSEISSQILSLKQELQQREQLALLLLQLDSVVLPTDPEPSLIQTQNKISEISSVLAQAMKRDAALTEHAQMNTENLKVQGLQADVTALHVLHTLAKNKEAGTLKAVVSSINEALAEICPSIFEDDIYLQLNLFTEKGKTESKPKVNFSATYKGATMDSISQFSGGEGDRASIAVTLALSSLSGCPFILLDESLGGLDSITKDKVVSVLTEGTINKSVILIMQEGVEGYYDHVISL